MCNKDSQFFKFPVIYSLLFESSTATSSKSKFILKICLKQFWVSVMILKILLALVHCSVPKSLTFLGLFCHSISLLVPRSISSFLLLHNNLSQTQELKATCLLSHNFPGSRFQTCLSWVICLNSHKAAINISVKDVFSFRL